MFSIAIIGQIKYDLRHEYLKTVVTSFVVVFTVCDPLIENVIPFTMRIFCTKHVASVYYFIYVVLKWMFTGDYPGTSGDISTLSG